MMLVPLLVFSDQVLGLKIAVALMLIHGLASPLMFMLVRVLYSVFSTRQIVLMRGVLVLSPILAFFCSLAFFISISAPPFPGFVNEVYSFMSICAVREFFYLLPLLIPFLRLVYNLLWFSCSIFGSSSDFNKATSCFLTFKDLYPVFFVIAVFVPVAFMFYFF